MPFPRCGPVDPLGQKLENIAPGFPKRVQTFDVVIVVFS
jgi:hypothetical protein